MKYLLATTVAVLLMTTPAVAKTLVVKYPEVACAEILSQEYSTGGGDSVVQFLEILCRDANGNYTGFVLSMTSASGFFGLGRFTTPDTIKYVPYAGTTLVTE